jgi:hypothetical protein
MSGTALDRDLQAFGVELFEHAGGVAEWPAADVSGAVVVPADVAARAQLPGEAFSLGLRAAPGSLHVSLSGEFLDAASRVLEIAVPRRGSFCIGERYLTRGDLSDKVAQAFAWQNARAKCGAAEPALVGYHYWTLHGIMQSEDVWEGFFHVTVNEDSGAILELPDVFQEPDLGSALALPAPAIALTYDAAIAEGRRRLVCGTADFVRRLDARLERDRKRLEDYYRALLLEGKGSKRRAVAAPSPEENDAREQAVKLELRRKLAELSERYAILATLRPVTLARVRIPTLGVGVRIQRKQAIRDYRVYWNPLIKKLEPLACSRCRRATYWAAFADETVDLLCKACQEGGQ